MEHLNPNNSVDQTFQDVLQEQKTPVTETDTKKTDTEETLKKLAETIFSLKSTDPTFLEKLEEFNEARKGLDEPEFQRFEESEINENKNSEYAAPSFSENRLRSWRFLSWDQVKGAARKVAEKAKTIWSLSCEKIKQFSNWIRKEQTSLFSGDLEKKNKHSYDKYNPEESEDIRRASQEGIVERVQNKVLSYNKKDFDLKLDETKASYKITNKITKEIFQLPLIKNKKLTIGKKIEAGTYGIVHKGTYDGKSIIIKKINKLEKEDDYYQEIIHQAILSPHPCVTQLLGITENGEFVFEECELGDLKKYLLKNNLEPEQLKQIAIDVADGMAHLTANGIVHDDLAARNVLLYKDTDGKLRAKVADFGLSKYLGFSKQSDKAESAIGPLKWMAPERMLQQVYSEKSDVWSYGVLLFELFSKGADPYEGIAGSQASVEIAKGRLRLTVPQNLKEPILKDIFLNCFKDSEDRFYFRGICQKFREGK